MLFRTLDKIRKKPKPVRDQYAFGIALAFTAILVGVWSLSLPARFTNLAGGKNEANTSSAPFSNLVKQFKQGFGTAKDSVASAIIAASSTITTEGGNSVTTSTSSTSKQSRPVSIIISSSTSASSASSLNYIQIGTSSSGATSVR
jgi:hypothetical protein